MPVFAQVPYTASPDLIWEAVSWLHSRTVVDSDAKDLAPQVAPLLERVEVVRTEQRRRWQTELNAQAAVDYLDDRVDDTVKKLDHTLLPLVNHERKSPRYMRYFTDAPHAIMRLGLESELNRVAPWVDSLKSEPERELRAIGERLEKDVADGRAVIEQRRQAHAATADHRVREIVRLIDDVNRCFMSVAGVLVQRAAERGLPRDWPSRFFRHRTSHVVVPDEPAPPVTPNP